MDSSDNSYRRSISLALSAMPGGVEVGSFVHGVLEQTDFAAADIDDELRSAIDAATARRAVERRGPRPARRRARTAIEYAARRVSSTA